MRRSVTIPDPLEHKARICAAICDMSANDFICAAIDAAVRSLAQHSPALSDAIGNPPDTVPAVTPKMAADVIF